MGLMDWLRSLAETPEMQSERQIARRDSGNTRSAVHVSSGNIPPTIEAPELTEAEKKSMVIGGLDFLDAITAHQRWKTRLAKYIGGTSDEKLDYRSVCRDNQCVLGKWINEQGNRDFGNAPTFNQLKLTHTQFHLSAGSIVRLLNEGKADLAKEALSRGDYPKHSVKVQGLISSLYMEVQDQNRRT